MTHFVAKNVLLTLSLLGCIALFGQADEEQAFREELGPRSSRTLTLKNCSGEPDNLIFDQIVLQPHYSPSFMERATARGITSSFFEQYGYIGEIPTDGSITYQTVEYQHQLVLMKNASFFSAYDLIDFSPLTSSSSICVDDYWYKNNTNLFVDQMIAGQIAHLVFHVYQAKVNKSAFEQVQQWVLARSNGQIELTVKEEGKITQKAVVNEIFLQGLRNWETRVRELPQEQVQEMKRGLVESYLIGDKDTGFYMKFSTIDAEARELKNLEALLELL